MKTYLFDFDGTLMDSMERWGYTVLQVLREQGLQESEGILRTLTPLGYVGSARLYKEMGAADSVEQMVERMKELAAYEYAHNVYAKAGVKDYLQRLKAEGASLNILTASPHTSVDPCLAHNGMPELFDNIWTVDDFALTKSQPEIYHAAAERLGCGVEEILFFDDNIIALQTAQKAGCVTVGVYDASSAGDTPAIRETVDTYIQSFEELL